MRLATSNVFPPSKIFFPTEHFYWSKALWPAPQKIKGLRGAKLGNPYLRWAFGEAAIIAKRDHAQIGPLSPMNGNKFKANTVVAIKLARSARRSSPQEQNRVCRRCSWHAIK